jgi:hypothetical protein
VVHAAEQESLVAARGTRESPIKKAVLAKYTRGLMRLIERQDGSIAEQLLAFWEEHQGRVESDEALAAVMSQLQPIAEMLERLRSTPGFDVDAMKAKLGESEDRSLSVRRPGVYLERALRGARQRNLDRNSKRSDLVDLHHVQYLPYVDVFTTDKENVAALSPLLANATLRRSGKLLRNRNLARVTEELVRLGGG